MRKEFQLDLKPLIRRLSERQSYPAGAEIFAEGESATTMFLVLEGQVKLSIRGEPMGVEKQGAIIGEMALIDSAQRSATAIAATDCVLAPLDREQFIDLLGEMPELSLHVMAILAKRLRLANDILTAI
jgi:CRP-like cAMP-binding protein